MAWKPLKAVLCQAVTSPCGAWWTPYGVVLCGVGVGLLLL
jgi:hypothetical protein